ncbi:MAG: hypothetical protein AAGD08_15985 [Pseudomonadota bacterium]
MSNDYFNHTNRAAPQTLVRSKFFNDVMDLVVTGFGRLFGLEDFYTARTDYAIDSGAADAYVLTYARGKPPAAYLDGMQVRFRPGATNTGASTVNVHGLGAVAVTRANGDALSAGDLVVGQSVVLEYDGTRFKLLNRGEVGPTGTVSAAGDGSVSAPGFAYALDPDTGFYRAGSGEQRVAADGADQFVMIRPSQSEAEAGADNFRPMTSLRVYEQQTARIASLAEAQAGTAAAKILSPQRVQQWFDFHHASDAEAAAGTASEKWMSPARVAGVLSHQRIATQEITSAVSAVEFTTGLDDAFDSYMLLIDRLVKSGSAFLQLRTGNGAFDSGASDYDWYNAQGNGATSSDPAASEINLTRTSVVSTAIHTGVLHISRARDASTHTYITGQMENSIGNQTVYAVAGVRVANAVIDRVQVLVSAGTLDSGRVTLIGVRI